VLKYSKARGWIATDKENVAEPAKEVMPAIIETEPKVPPLPVERVPALMVALQAIDKPVARALRWTILTACRTGEALGATWGEINGDWTVPGRRMKEGKSTPCRSCRRCAK